MNTEFRGTSADTGTGGTGGNDIDRSRRFAFVMRALGRTPISLFYQSRDLVNQWAENLPRGIALADVVGHGDDNFLPPITAQRFIDAKRTAIETHEPQRFEAPLILDSDVRWFDVRIDPDIDARGTVAGIFSTMVETTEQKQREAQLRSLLREVSHRSKNLLAIILSLAAQTARHSTSVAGFVKDFSGRLQAIARAQDLVTDRDWQGALLSDLILQQVALFRGGAPLTVRISGEDRMVSPGAALYVGLAIHELAAHALRGGRLASDPIAVTIESRTEEAGQEALTIAWDEQGGQTGTFEDLPKAFLEKVVPLAVDGEGVIVPADEGLRYRLTIGTAHVG